MRSCDRAAGRSSPPLTGCQRVRGGGSAHLSHGVGAGAGSAVRPRRGRIAPPATLAAFALKADPDARGRCDRRKRGATWGVVRVAWVWADDWWLAIARRLGATARRQCGRLVLPVSPSSRLLALDFGLWTYRHP